MGKRKSLKWQDHFISEANTQQIKNQKWSNIDKERLESVADTLGINYQLKMKILSYDFY